MAGRQGLTTADLTASMQPFVYDALPGRVVFGDGAFDRVPDELDRLGVDGSC